MKNEYKKITTPLLRSSKKPTYQCTTFYELYWGHACVEFKFSQDNETYLFYSLASFIENLLLFLSHLKLSKPCSILQRYETFYTNFDDAFDDWYKIEDKALLIDNLKQVTIENYINLKRKKTSLNSYKIRLWEIYDLAKHLIWLVEDSADNSLYMKYD